MVFCGKNSKVEIASGVNSLFVFRGESCACMWMLSVKRKKGKKYICHGHALLSIRADYTCDNSIFRISCDLSLLLLFRVAHGQSSELFLFARDWLIDTHIFKIICIYMNINQSQKKSKKI